VSSQRKVRLEHSIREELQDLVANEVRDPRVKAATLLTIAKVELNVDNSVAMVYVSVVGEDATADGVIEGLKKAAGFLRGPIGRRLNLQHAPELRFALDRSIDMSQKIASVLREDAEKARAAGREPEPNPAVPVKRIDK
jgi:ribosome-binding factor A